MECLLVLPSMTVLCAICTADQDEPRILTVCDRYGLLIRVNSTVNASVTYTEQDAPHLMILLARLTCQSWNASASAWVSSGCKVRGADSIFCASFSGSELEMHCLPYSSCQTLCQPLCSTSISEPTFSHFSFRKSAVKLSLTPVLPPPSFSLLSVIIPCPCSFPPPPTQVSVCVHIYIERERGGITKSKHVLYWTLFTQHVRP